MIQTTIIQFWFCDIIFCWNKSLYSRFFFLHKKATFFIWLICINSDRECACACGSDINTFLDLWQKKNKNIFWYWNFFVQKYVTQSHNPHRQFIEKKKPKKRENIGKQTRRERLDQINHTYWRKKKIITKLIRKSNIQSSRQENPISEILPSQKNTPQTNIKRNFYHSPHYKQNRQQKDFSPLPFCLKSKLSEADN